MPADGAIGDAEAFAQLVRRMDRGRLVRVGMLMALASATEGVGLLMLVPIIQVVSGAALPAIASRWVAPLAALPLGVLLAGFVALVALRAVIVYAVTTQRSALALVLTRSLRIEAQSAILAAEWRWLSAERSSDHGALIVGGADRIGKQANRSLDVAAGLITLAALLAAAFWLAWRLTLLTLALGAATAIVLVMLRQRRETAGGSFYEAYTRLHRHVGEGLAHLRAARIAGAQDTLARDFDRATADLERTEQAFERGGKRGETILQIVAAVLLAVLVWFGLVVLVLPLSLFVPVLAIFARIVPLIGNIQQGWRAWRFCRPALTDQLATVAAARAAAEPVAATGAPLDLREAITLAHVSARFPGRERPVFAGFDLAIPAGSVVGITGRSGSGKSTLADLLSGLIVPDSGTIAVDGTALVGERRMRWRRQVAYVEQVPHLFDGTIADNLAWGHAHAAPAALADALHAASAGFVLRLPAGLDTLVGEGGRQLSGGERQRIALARALLRQPSLVILDEVTAALDAANEAAIARTIESLRGSATFVILGHRPALLDIADHVIELHPHDG